MEQKYTAAKALTASLGGIGGSAAVIATLPPEAPIWAHLVVWAVPQIIAMIVYIVPNKPV